MSTGQNSAHLIPQNVFLFNLSRPCEINLGPVHQKKITLRAVVHLTRPKKTIFHECRILLGLAFQTCRHGSFSCVASCDRDLESKGWRPC